MKRFRHAEKLLPKIVANQDCGHCKNNNDEGNANAAIRRFIHAAARPKAGILRIDAPQVERGSVELADNRTGAVGENYRATGLDYGLGPRCHDVRTKIEFAGRDSDDGDHDGGSKSDHDNLEVGGAVCGVQRPIHVADETSSKPNGLLYLWAMRLYEGTSCSIARSAVPGLLKSLVNLCPPMGASALSRNRTFRCTDDGPFRAVIGANQLSRRTFSMRRSGMSQITATRA